MNHRWFALPYQILPRAAALCLAFLSIIFCKASGPLLFFPAAFAIAFATGTGATGAGVPGGAGQGTLPKVQPHLNPQTRLFILERSSTWEKEGFELWYAHEFNA